MGDEREAFSLRALCRAYGIDASVPSRAIRAGELPAARLGKRRFLILRADWEKFVRRKAVQPDSHAACVVEQRLRRERGKPPAA